MRRVQVSALAAQRDAAAARAEAAEQALARMSANGASCMPGAAPHATRTAGPHAHEEARRQRAQQRDAAEARAAAAERRLGALEVAGDVRTHTTAACGASEDAACAWEALRDERAAREAVAAELAEAQRALLAAAADSGALSGGAADALRVAVAQALGVREDAAEVEIVAAARAHAAAAGEGAALRDGVAAALGGGGLRSAEPTRVLAELRRALAEHEERVRWWEGALQEGEARAAAEAEAARAARNEAEALQRRVEELDRRCACVAPAGPCPHVRVQCASGTPSVHPLKCFRRRSQHLFSPRCDATAPSKFTV